MTSIERRIRDLLAEVYTPQGVEIWMTARHGQSGRSPQEMILSGEGRRVLEWAEILAGGAW